MNNKIEEGFAGQISIVLPHDVRKRVSENAVIKQLYLTDIGFYPLAKHHYRERPLGSEENILIYVIEGAGEVGIGSTTFPILKDEYIIIPKNVSHWYKANQLKPWSIYWIHFTGEGEQIFKEYMGKVFALSHSPYSRINERLRLFDEIIEILSLGFSPDHLVYANLCMMHLLASFRYVEQYRKINYAGEKDVVKKSQVFMKQHIGDAMSLEELAQNAGLSVSHFSRLFKQRTRHSPLDYFIQLKVQHACQLLDYSELRVLEIANAVGYDDAYYFSRVFKKVMGVSPMIYRQRAG
ncbi:MAG: helix-turn-helix domain-containing protein [Prolixibacteraceae bacterium]